MSVIDSSEDVTDPAEFQQCAIWDLELRASENLEIRHGILAISDTFVCVDIELRPERPQRYPANRIKIGKVVQGAVDAIAVRQRFYLSSLMISNIFPAQYV